MKYRVLYTDQFHEALDTQVEYFPSQDEPPTRIATWINELLQLMDSLEVSPKRFPMAELESAIAGLALRKVVFGNYLAFYHVDDARREVQLLGFRHSARLP